MKRKAKNKAKASDKQKISAKSQEILHVNSQFSPVLAAIQPSISLAAVHHLNNTTNVLFYNTPLGKRAEKINLLEASNT